MTVQLTETAYVVIFAYESSHENSLTYHSLWIARVDDNICFAALDVDSSSALDVQSLPKV